jgi:CheY-like chemotaxis protein
MDVQMPVMDGYTATKNSEVGKKLKAQSSEMRKAEKELKAQSSKLRKIGVKLSASKPSTSEASSHHRHDRPCHGR